MDILIATNHLVCLGGSEVVCLETAAYFQSLGHNVTVFANVSGAPMADHFRSRLGIEIVTEPEQVAPFCYDLVYFQHHVAGLFRYENDGSAREKTAFVFGKLGWRIFMETGGWRHDRLLADRYFANAELTAEKLRDLGVQAPINVFHNAAPASYFRSTTPRRNTLKRIVVVTNHREPTLMKALDRLAEKYTVKLIGFSSGRQQLVTPELVQSSDLIVTIGKTVVYALAARVPVYVYDHFGGPGYLTRENVARAAHYNFNGSCCSRRLDAETLANEIVTRYPAGLAFAEQISDADLDRYRLEHYLDAMLATPPSANAPRAAALAADPMVGPERLLASYLRDETRSQQAQQNRPQRLIAQRVRSTYDRFLEATRGARARLKATRRRLLSPFTP